LVDVRYRDRELTCSQNDRQTKGQNNRTADHISPWRSNMDSLFNETQCHNIKQPTSSSFNIFLIYSYANLCEALSACCLLQRCCYDPLPKCWIPLKRPVTPTITLLNF